VFGKETEPPLGPYLGSIVRDPDDFADRDTVASQLGLENAVQVDHLVHYGYLAKAINATGEEGVSRRSVHAYESRASEPESTGMGRILKSAAGWLKAFSDTSRESGTPTPMG